MTDEQPIAWTAIAPGTPLRCSDGSAAGRVVDVLGSRDEDVFHGLVVALEGRRAVILADFVGAMTTGHVETTLTPAEVRALPDDEGAPTFHAAQRGIVGSRVRERERFEPDERGR